MMDSSIARTGIAIGATMLLWTMEVPRAIAAEWVSVGPGGGGGLFAPASSPHDPNLMFVSCDMGGFYRSTDGGASWRMLDGKQIKGSTTCRPVFHPTNPSIVYAASERILKRSDDSGVTFTDIWTAPQGGSIRQIALDPDDPNLIIVGNGSLFRTTNGRDFSLIATVSGDVNGIMIDPAGNAQNRTIFVGTATGVYRSSDRGATFSNFWAQGVLSLTGGRQGSTLLVFAATTSGIYRSVDGGSFAVVLNPPNETFGFVGMAQNQTAIVYATGNGGSIDRGESVWRSASRGDAGSWENTFRGHPYKPDPNVDEAWLTYDVTWGWGGPAIGFGVNARDSNLAMFTDTGRLFITRNGGGRWQQAYSHYAGDASPAKGEPWSSIGLEVTSCYHYLFDPNDEQRHYIAYTDIGFFRSEDAGKSWLYGAEGCTWRNTFYEVVLDGSRPGTMYAAASNQHDIPFWSGVGYQADAGSGGVCKSTDYGKTWSPASTGLPVAPATSIAIDPNSPQTLYVAIYGKGVYKTTNGGGSWSAVNTGLAIAENGHVYALAIHPDGSIFCSKTGYRPQGDESNFRDNSGLFKSTDAGASWVSLNGSIEGISAGKSWAYAIDFSVDPRDSNTIYLAAFDATNGRVQGGVYKTTDGGATWRRTYKVYNAFFPYLDPQDPDHILLTAPHSGLFESQDAGEHWEELSRPPFLTVLRPAYDPTRSALYVTTFGGGVWKEQLESTCTNACGVAGQSSCSGGALKQCVVDGQGCLSWSAEAACSTGLCATEIACCLTVACDGRCCGIGQSCENGECCAANCNGPGCCSQWGDSDPQEGDSGAQSGDASPQGGGDGDSDSTAANADPEAVQALGCSCDAAEAPLGPTTMILWLLGLILLHRRRAVA